MLYYTLFLYIFDKIMIKIIWDTLKIFIFNVRYIYYCRAAILAISAYLEAFQKIADAATNARGKFLLIN